MEQACVLSRCKSREFVETEPVGLGGVAVEVLDVAKSRHKNAQTEVVFITSVEIVRITHPLQEVALLVDCIERGGTHDEEKHCVVFHFFFRQGRGKRCKVQHHFL